MDIQSDVEVGSVFAKDFRIQRRLRSGGMGSVFVVEQISTVNEALLAEILGHTRYADGQSSVQWLCEQYLFDDGAA